MLESQHVKYWANTHSRSMDPKLTSKTFPFVGTRPWQSGCVLRFAWQKNWRLPSQPFPGCEEILSRSESNVDRVFACTGLLLEYFLSAHFGLSFRTVYWDQFYVIPPCFGLGAPLLVTTPRKQFRLDTWVQAH